MSRQIVLTGEQKLAGRVFRAVCQHRLDGLNVTDPPDYTPFYLLKVYRHLCPKHNNTSWPLTLKELYWVSPDYWITKTDEVSPVSVRGGVHIPAGSFAFITKEGKCSSCQRLARSVGGMFVPDAPSRPPLDNRVARL